MLRRFPSSLVLSVLLVFEMSSFSFAEPIVLGSSVDNSVQIKLLKQREGTVFEIQLGGGANQPPANTWLAGKASTVIGQKQYSGYYRISTDPSRQIQMKLQSTGKDYDEYSFVTGHDVLYFEFAPAYSFTDPWLTGKITNVAATQQVTSNGDQNSRNQDNGNNNNGDKHSPISLIGKLDAPTGGSLAKFFDSGGSQLLLNVGGNQRLSVLTPGNSFSGMKLEQGSYYLPQR